MKTIILFFFLTYSLPSFCAKIIFSYDQEKISKVADFPDTAIFMTSEGHYFDAGLRYKQFSIFLIPLWNYDLTPCGYISDKYYVDLNRNELNKLANYSNISLPQNFRIDFWNSIGGKLLFIIILFVIIFLNVYGKSETEKQ